MRAAHRYQSALCGLPIAASSVSPHEDLLDSREVKKSIWRAVIEVGFIIFLFYSNLLMGEFEHSGMGPNMGLAWAIGDIFTAANFAIAITAALIGYVVFESLRNKF